MAPRPRAACGVWGRAPPPTGKYGEAGGLVHARVGQWMTRNRSMPLYREATAFPDDDAGVVSLGLAAETTLGSLPLGTKPLLSECARKITRLCFVS